MGQNEALNTNFRPLFKDGAWEIVKLPMAETVVMQAGSAVRTDLAGEVTIMDAAAETNFLGILLEDIRAADTDYDTARKRKSVAVPLRQSAECEFTVGAGTFTTADEGKTVAVHTNGRSVAVDTAGTQIRILRFLSATRGVCSFATAFSQT